MRTSAAVSWMLLMACASAAVGDDWPQWMGPRRDNVWRETGLLDKFPEGGPKIVWRAPVGGGYAGPAVADGKVYVTDFVRSGEAAGENWDRKGIPGVERVLCLDEKTGEALWKHEYPVSYTVAYPGGTRCTPLVRDGKVYTLGTEGDLFCFDAAGGKVFWSNDLKKSYGTKAPLWGYAAHPLLDGDKLITLAGGKGSQAVALDRNTGKELWRTLDTPEIGQGYVPPSILEAGGVRQLILAQPDSLNAVDPETGKILWSVPYEADNGSVIMTPVRSGGHLFLGGYNGRTLLVTLAENTPTATTVWKDKPKAAISPVNVQPFVEGDVIYGFDGDGQFTAAKLPSGARLWRTPQPVSRRPVGSGTAFLVRQADRLWMFCETGDLVIGQVSPQGFKELDRAHVLAPTGAAFNRDVAWCAPAFADGKMFVRNDKELVCIDLSAAQ